MTNFEMKIEYKIKYAYFFHGITKNINTDDEILDESDKINKKKGLAKKNYIFVLDNGEVIIKNLGLRKKSNSDLSRKIFFDYLLPDIKKGTAKFGKMYIKNLIVELLNKDLMLGALRKDVGSLDEYSKSPTGLQAKLSKRYGSGIHFTLPNKKCGEGMKTKYCTVEEFKEKKLTMEDIDYDFYMSELNYFVKEVPQKNIFEY